MQNRKNTAVKIFRVFAPSRFCVKKSFLLFIFVLLFSIAAFAQTPRTIPADFVDDGCSLFPDCDYGDCCAAHDRAYYVGGTEKERRQADKKLYKCVRAKKGFYHKIIAPVMYLGVRIGGVSWLPTPFRWGFGKDREKRKAKKKLSQTRPKI